jgi:hypothetical protein
LLKISNDDAPKALEEVSRKIEDLYKVDMEVFMNMDNEQLLKSDWSITFGMADKLADFLTISANIALTNQRFDMNDNLLRKALYLYELSESQSKTYSHDRIVAIEQIRHKLGI